MTVQVYTVDGDVAHSLIYHEHLAMLSVLEQETMYRAITNSSRLWVGMDGDKVLALWGLVAPTLMSDIAYLWLFTTKHLTGHTFALIRHSQRSVQEMLQEYSCICGHGAIDNPRSLRWLRWLGAEFGDPQGNFLPFTIRAKQQWRQDSAQSA